MYSRKEKLFVIGIASILLVLVFMIIFILFTSPSSSSKQQSAPITPTPSEQSGQPMVSEQRSQEKLLDRVKDRKQLSKKDLAVKNYILSHLTSVAEGGIVYQSPEVTLSYDSSLEIFQAVILTTSIDQAKREVNLWFQKQGMSQEGICNLPVAFFLDPAIATQLQNTPFSPLALGCE